MNDFSSIFNTFSSNRLIIIVALLVLFWTGLKVIHSLLNRLAERYAARRILIKNFSPLITILFHALAAYIILFRILKIETSSFVAIGVSAGVAIGFAGKDLLANIFAGIVIITTRPFNIGDKIEVGTYYGEIIDITLFRVKMQTLDDSTVNIPNKLFLETSISNSNSGELNCQVVTQLKIKVNEDLAAVEKTAFEAVRSSPYTYMKKPVVILFKDAQTELSPYTTVVIKSYVFDHRYEKKYSSDIYKRMRQYYSL